MQLTPEQLNKVKKLAKFVDNTELATLEEFETLNEKVDSISLKVDDSINEVKETIGQISEELKKKLESELVLEIDKEELRGEDGKDYVLTDDDKKEIASSIKVPIVEKIVEKVEIIKEQPIEITKEIKIENPFELKGDDVITKINEDESELKISSNKIDGIKSYDADIATLQNRTQILNQMISNKSSSGTGSGNPFDYLQLKTSYTSTGSETTGTTYWDSANHTTSTVLENGVILQNGQEVHIYGKNVSGSPILNGTPVSIVQNNGQFTAFGTVDITTPVAYAFVGLATQDIAINAFGYVTKIGVVRGIDTSAYDEGKPVYVSSTGGLTKTYPTVPNYVINVGIVEYKHANQGRINVIPLIVPKLGDLSDVNGTPKDTNGQLVLWNNDSGYFDMSSLVYINGLSSTDSAGSITLRELASDSSVTIGIVGDDGYFYINPETAYPNVIIGSPNSIIPLSKLAVMGNFAVGNAFDSLLAPENGAIIEGDVGIGTSTPRGILDLNRVIIPADVTNGSMTFNYGSGLYTASNYPFDFQVYTFKYVGSKKVYSAGYLPLYGTDDGSSRNYTITLNWDAVVGVDGYKIVVYDEWFGSGYDNYIETEDTTVTINGGDLYVYEYPMILTPAGATADVYFDYFGNLNLYGNQGGGNIESTGHANFNKYLTVTELDGVHSALTVKGTSDGGESSRNLIKGVGQYGDTTFLAGHIGDGVTGYLAMCGTESSVETYFTELDFLNFSATGSDKRVAIIQGVTETASADYGQLFFFLKNSGGLQAVMAMKSNGRIYMKDGGISTYGIAPGGTLSIEGTLCVGDNTTATGSADTNGAIITGYIRTKTGFKSSDGTAGLTTTQQFKDGAGVTKTMTFKSGLLTQIA